jgi:hypothetical protein
MTSYSWNTGTSGGWGTIANWGTTSYPNSITADVTISASGSYTVTIETAKSYTVDSVTLNDGSAALDVLGTLTLGGTQALLNIEAGTVELGGVVSGGTVSINNGATLQANGGSLKNLADLYMGGAGNINLNSKTLAIGGTSTLQGYIFNPGELILSGVSTFADDPYFEAGVTLDETGTIDLTSNVQFGSNGTAATVFTIGATGTVDITAVNSGWGDDGTLNVTNAGLIENTGSASYYNISYNSFVNTGTLSAISGSDISLYGGTAQLGGHIAGAGELYLGSGTDSLESGLVFTAGTLGVNSNDTLILETGFSLATQFDATNSSDVDLNGFNLTLSSANGGVVRGYVYGGGTLDITGSYAVGGLYLASGTEELVTGTAVQDNFARLDYDGGTAASILSIASTGTYDVTVINNYIDYNNTIGNIINAGLFENIEQTPTYTSNGNDDSYFNVYENFTNAATGTIYMGTADDISLLYGQDTLAGTITGPGDIYFGQHATVSLEAGLVLNNGRYLSISDGSTDVILESNRTFTSTYFELENSANLNLNGYTLSLAAGESGQLGAYVSGPGTINAAGTFYVGGLYMNTGVTDVVSGVQIMDGTVYLDDDYQSAGTSEISITTAGTFDITTDSQLYNGYNNNNGTGLVINAGLIEKTGYDQYTNIYADFTNASTGTIYIAADDDISLIASTSSLAGTIEGPGYIYFGQGETVTLDASLVMNGLDGFTASDGNTQVILEANETFAAPTVFTDQSSADIQLNGNTLTLAGKSQFSNAYVAGSGTLDITGSADFNNFYAIGTMTVIDAGTITEDGFNELGINSSSNVTLSISSTAVYNIINDTYINPQTTSAIDNAGLFEKTASEGVSDIYAPMINTGTIDAVTGTLRFDSGGTLAGTIIGTGEVDLNGGTFSLASSAVLSVTDFYLTGGTFVLEKNQTFTSLFAEESGTLDLNGFNVALDNAGDYLANSYLQGPGTLTESARADVYNYYLTDGAVLDDAGTITQDGGLQLGAFSGDTASLTIATTGTYDILNDNAINTGGTPTTEIITNAGLFEKTADNGNSNIYAVFNNTGTLDAAVGVISLAGGGTLAGTLTGAGELALAQYYSETYTLAASAVLSVATFALSGATLDLESTRSLSTVFIENGGTLNLDGFNLTISNNRDELLNSYVDGPGTLDVTGVTYLQNYYVIGGAVLQDSGTINEDYSNLNLGQNGTDSGTLNISAGAVYNFISDNYIYVNGSGTINNAGLYEKTAANGISYTDAVFNNTGTIDAVRGTLQLAAGGTLGGTLEGAGTIELNGGVFSLTSAAVVSVATIDDVGATLDLLSSRTIAGTIVEYGGNSAIALGGDTLTLSGNDYLNNYLEGPGTLDVTGTTDLNNYNLTGGAVLVDAGTITMDNNVQIGENSTDTGTLSITSAGTFNILTDNYIYESGTVNVVNAGLFEKTGSGNGKSYVQAGFTNTGTIAALSGDLEEQALTNDGVLKISNAYDQTDNLLAANTGDKGTIDLTGNATFDEQGGVAASQTVVLTGSNDLIDLVNGGTSFAGTITGFTTSDTIDLQGVTYNGFSYAGGELVLTENGSVEASIALAGITNAGSLGLISDGGSGTDVTFSSPGTITQPNGSVVTDTWTVTSGDFNTAANWSLGVPGTLSTAFIPGGAGAATITDSGSNTIYSLAGQDYSATLAQSAGTLRVIDGGYWDGALAQTGGEILDETNVLQFESGGTIAGTLAGAGYIEVGANQQVDTLAATAVLSVATFGLESNATLALESNRSYNGTFSTNESGTTDLDGYNLTLGGTALLDYNGSFVGPGSVTLAGQADINYFFVNTGATLDITGTATQQFYYINLGNSSTDTAALSIASTGTYDLTADSNVDGQGAVSLFDSGLLEKTGDNGTSYIQNLNLTQASSGVINDTRGALVLVNDAGTLAGTLEGAFIDLNGDAFTIAAGAVLSVATLQIQGGNTITLGGGRTYAGNFDMSANGGGTLNLGSFGLDLTGPAELGGEYVGGSGIITVAASADMAGMQLVNSASLVDAGTITQDGGFALGYYGTDTNELVINAGAVYDIINANNIGASGTAAISNSGLFEKTGDFGISYIAPVFTNASTGTIDVTGGTIDLQSGGTLNGTIEGAGELELQNNNGTFTLASTAVLTVGTLNVNEDLVLEHAETFTGDFIQTNNINLNGFALSLTGTAALDSSIEGPGTLTVTKGDVNGLYLYQGAAMVVKGTVTQDGGFTMSNTSTDSTSLSIASGAVFDLLTDNSINANGTAAITNAGLFEKTGDYGESYIYPAFTNASTGTINLARGYLDFENGGSFAGLIEGAVDGSVPQGAIIEGGGVLTLASTATLSVAEFALQGGDLLLGGSRTYAGYFDGTGGSLSLNGDTLSVTAPYLGGFYLTGPGTLNVSGSATLNGLGQTIGSVLDDKGTIVMDGGYQLGYYSSDASELTIASGATFDIITDNSIGESGTAAVILNAGLFEKTADNGQSYVEPNFTNASTGIVDVTHGTLTFIYDNAVLGGTLEGAGEIILQSGGDTLTSSVVTVATLDVNSYPTLGTNLTYGGYFILTSGDTMTLSSHALVLSGTAALIGGFYGGSVTVSGSAYVQTLDLFGGSTLVDNGYINQIDELRFGLNDGSSDTLSIGAHGTYNIQDDSNFHSYGNSGSAEVAINAGLLEKTGDTGLSELEVTLTNTGTVLVTSGTLQVDAVSNLASGTLSGGTWVEDAGLLGPTLALQGGTLAVDAAKITLSGAGTELYAGGTLLETSLATVASGGVLALLGGRGFAAPNTLTDAGTIILEGGTLATPGLTVAAGGTLSGYGTVTGAITDNGLIAVTDPTLTLTGSLSGTGSVLIDADSTLILGAGAASGTSITFGGSLDVLVLDTASSVHSTLVSLAPSDTIDLAGLTATAATISGGNLIVTISGGSTETFALSGANTLDRAAIQSDGNGGTDIAIFAKATAGAIAPVTKNFGEAHAGAVLTQTYTIANTGAYGAYSEDLDAKAGPHSTLVTNSGSFTGLTPGSTNSTALHATLVTTNGGLISGAADVSLYTDGSTVPGDGDGTLAIGTDTVTLTGTIFNYATADLSPAVDNLGKQHVGGVLSNFLTIANGAVAGNYSENLDASFSGTSSDLTGTGSVSELAAGSTNSTGLGVTLTSAGGDGVQTGTATLGLISDGSTIDTLGTTTLASQTVTVTETLYNYATASAVAPNPIGFGEAHVGATLSQYLTIANTAAADGYSENLDASFSGTSSDLTGTGSVSELAAGSSNGSALDLVLASGAAGVQSGSATLSLVSDGSTIDGLGTTGLGSETVAVSGTLFNYATASVAPTTIAFGQAHIGAALTQTLTLANEAASGIYSENLDASFSGTSTVLTAAGSVSELAAGSTNSTALALTLHSIAAGVKSGTTTLGLISDGSGIDTLGTTTLAGQAVTVTGTLFGLATAAVSPKPLSFGQHHVGDALDGFITIANKGSVGGYYENLDASFSGTSSLVTGSGDISELAAGATNSSALELILASGTAGVKTGTATLALTSDGSGIDTLGTTALTSQVVTASSTLFNYATASTNTTAVGFGIVHVGQAVSKDITLTNKAAVGAYSENLDASFSGTSGNFLTNGSVSELKAGSANSTSLQVTLETGAAGVQSGTTTLGLVSDGSTIDTLGTTVLNGETVTLKGTVNNYATATIETISGPGVLSGSGTTLTLNLGSVVKGAAAVKETIGILNSAIGPADSLDGSLSLTGTTGFVNSGDQAFTNKAAGAADTSPIITLTTGTIGTYTETIVVTTTGTNSSGYSGALAPETLIVTGTVTAAGAAVPAASSDAAAVPSSTAAMQFAVPSKAAAKPAAGPLTGSAATEQFAALRTDGETGKSGISAWFSVGKGAGETVRAPDSTVATAGVVSAFHLTAAEPRSGLLAAIDAVRPEHVA